MSPVAAPVFNSLDNTPIFNENSSAVLLDSDATITDADLNATSPIDGATLTLQRLGGASADDLLSGNFDEGQVISQISGLVVGSAVLSEGLLTVTFNGDAVFGDVNDVLQRLSYANGSDTPPPSVTIGYTFNNGDVATGSITITINPVNDAPSIDFVGRAARCISPARAGWSCPQASCCPISTAPRCPARSSPSPRAFSAPMCCRPMSARPASRRTLQAAC